ncbi:protein CTF7 [Actinidia rufa]|uniref:Protein CTF7 n=1 Tax=Actinidia rufa TaxID=165716 RepID=A0A7J0DCF6_9ERIC|nr:protein CTF7 [Actinidia rufa]
MQPKISDFFHPQPQILHQTLDRSLVYSSDKGSSQELHHLNDGDASQHIEEASKNSDLINSQNPSTISSKNLNKKRSYAQLYLDLGQSDFLLRTCSTCGFRYACGDEGDEKVHKDFHKDYTHGIQFKGWHNERVVHLPSVKEGRIILVLDDDPPAHKKKLQKVVETMEMDLGSGLLIHKLCKVGTVFSTMRFTSVKFLSLSHKSALCFYLLPICLQVYLYIFHQRIAGCLVAEPVETAHKVLSNSGAPKSINGTDANKKGSNSSVLRFGGISFQREAVTRAPSAINPEPLEDESHGSNNPRK